jgi:ABC-type Fe3+-hydroxamate transport system, periplasmic component
MTVNTERIIELNPDVVFAYTTGEEAQIDQLESAGLKVFVIQSATSINDVYGDIEQMADVMGVEEEGKQSCRRYSISNCSCSRKNKVD